ncbi:MAG: HRDC domain-containing protein [Planctomycetes bacterium]|nr:HRDC domain-containing protein [Planctomycetota bacterium]
MTPPELPPPVVVEERRGMERLVSALDREREIAVDTEANSFFNFHERVCLVQMTVGDTDYLIDPLADVDLEPLGRLFADPQKLKVFHDGEYDILMLKRGFRFEFKTLFDTRVAAAALGEANPGLATVLKNRFGVELDKSLQRSNWAARPLTDEQLRYARLDTHFLIPLMHEQQRELAEKRRAMIVEGECARLEQLVPPPNEFNPDEYVRLKGARALDPEGQQALRELFVLRHRAADAADLPPFKIMNNEVLIEIARRRPRSMRELTQVPGFSPRQARKLGDQVLSALARAKELGPLKRAPNLPSKDGTSGLSDTEFELHERLKLWRTERAKHEGFDASLVLNRHGLLRLAQLKPRTRYELVEVDGVQAWQIETFGDAIVKLIDESLREFESKGLPKSPRRVIRRGRKA